MPLRINLDALLNAPYCLILLADFAQCLTLIEVSILIIRVSLDSLLIELNRFGDPPQTTKYICLIEVGVLVLRVNLDSSLV
jgi:hypothetical protein